MTIHIRQLVLRSGFSLIGYWLLLVFVRQPLPSPSNDYFTYFPQNASPWLANINTLDPRPSLCDRRRQAVFCERWDHMPKLSITSNAKQMSYSFNYTTKEYISIIEQIVYTFSSGGVESQSFPSHDCRVVFLQCLQQHRITQRRIIVQHDSNCTQPRRIQLRAVFLSIFSRSESRMTFLRQFLSGFFGLQAVQAHASTDG